MLYYIIPYLVLISFYLVSHLFPREKRSITLLRVMFLIGFTPAILLVTLRGGVGTDTGNYIQMAKDIAQGGYERYGDYDVEFGFFFLIKFLTSMVDEPRIVINTISFFIAIYSYYLFAASKNSILVFILLIFPVFFYDMSMNGLRYGLAFLLAKHASDKYESNNKVFALALLIASIGFQLSGILVFFLLKVNRLKVSTAIYMAPLFLAVYIVFEQRLLYKLLSYQMLESPSNTSGLMPLIVFLLCYLIIFFESSAFSRQLLFFLIAEIAAFMLAGITYAGLRFQMLILFSFFGALSAAHFQSLFKKNAIPIFLLVVGVIGFSGKLRNFSDGSFEPGTPFLPYSFFWAAK